MGCMQTLKLIVRYVLLIRVTIKDYGDHQDGEITVMMLIVRMVPLMMTMIVGMVIYGDIYDDDDDLCEHARHDGEAGYFHILLI